MKKGALRVSGGRFFGLLFAGGRPRVRKNPLEKTSKGF